MSTDLYAVRVLEIDPDERRIRLRVVVIAYEIDENSGPVTWGVPPAHRLPRDASFFLRVLWDEGDYWGARSPITREIDIDQFCSDLWVADNCARFIDRVKQLQICNDPPVQWLWPQMGYAAQRPGGATVSDYEGLRTYADYDVWVTDRRWLAHLSAGQAWDTTAYDIRAHGFTRSLWGTSRTVKPTSGSPGFRWQLTDGNDHYRWLPATQPGPDNRPSWRKPDLSLGVAGTYRVRVLDVDLHGRRVRVRTAISLYHYLDKVLDGGRADGLEAHWPLPEDPTFFLCVLWEQADTTRGPLAEELTAEEVYTPTVINDLCVSYVDRVQQVAVRNDPPIGLRWPEMSDGNAEEEWRSTFWAREDQLTQADYDVWVTDQRWIQHMATGQTWDTTTGDARAYGYETSLWRTHRTNAD